MKKWQKTTLIIISGYISYYTSYILFKLLALNEQTIVVISTLIGLFPLILYIFVIRKMVKKENEEVRMRLSKNAIENARRFDIDIITNKWINMFNKL